MTADARAVPYVVAVQLPYPPSVNHLWRRVGNKTLKSAEGRAYHERCAGLALVARKQRDTWQPNGPLCVAVQVYPPDRRRRDLDNLLKASLDGLCAGLGVDDSTIAELHVYRWPPDKHQPELFVTVTPASERLLATPTARGEAGQAA